MEQERLAEDVRRLREALGELPEPRAQPFLIVVSGLPGTGKSHFSRKLAERLPCVIVESDALRKTLFPEPSYSAAESQRLFQALHLLIAELLGQGMPVLLDATNLVEHHRERLYSIAERLEVKLVIVRVEAPDELVRARLEGRGPGESSDAGLEVYRRMKPQAERIRRRHFAVDTARDITPVINKIIRELRR